MPNLCKTMFLALAVGAGSLYAQGADAPWGLGLNLRAGVTGGNAKDDMNSEKLLGAGITGFWSLGSGRAIVGELAYLRVPGKDVNAITFPSNVTASSSADRRKNDLEGFSIRAGYRAPMTGAWNWQAGLSLDKLKSRQEASGQLTTAGGVEPLFYTPSSSKLLPGAFAGLMTDLGNGFSFEVNALSFGYSQANWVPAAYSGSAARAEEKNRRAFGLEVAFGFKF